MNWAEYGTCVVENCSLCCLARHSALLTYSSVKNTFKATVLYVSHMIKVCTVLRSKGTGSRDRLELITYMGIRVGLGFYFFRYSSFGEKNIYVS